MARSLEELLGRGYFPEELPPPFTTKPYAEAIRANYGTLPPQFFGSAKPGKVAIHNRPRVGSLRRALGLPNPIHQFRICNEIFHHWRELNAVFAKSKMSLSLPVSRRYSGRALLPRYSMGALPLHRAAVRGTSRYVVQADISRFYHSIYTHSIPWALHGKFVAKKRRTDLRLLGNRLDKFIRDGQDNQTIGIPIGPDSSLAIAEAILCRIETEIPTRLKRTSLRYIDDFELGFGTLSQAEEALAELQERLSEYELALNPKKTRIIALPHPLDEPWVSELRGLTIANDSDAQVQHYDLLRYFDRAFELASAHPHEHVLNYAIQKVSAVLVAKRNWKLYQNLMLQCILSEPGTLRYGFAQLTRYKQMGYMVDLEGIRKVVNSLIEYHCRQAHGNEVAWAIWAAIYFGTSISVANGKRIGAMEDPVVALLALDARSRKVIPKSVAFDSWKSQMTTDNLYEKQWLLAYEANMKKWLPSRGKGDHVNRDPAFALLKANQVHFYDDSILGRIRAKQLPSEAAFMKLSTLFLQY